MNIRTNVLFISTYVLFCFVCVVAAFENFFFGDALGTKFRRSLFNGGGWSKIIQWNLEEWSWSVFGKYRIGFGDEDTPVVITRGSRLVVTILDIS